MQIKDHARHVAAWMDQAANDISSASALKLFERAWNALWHRAEFTIGEISLHSIAEVVRARSVERFPVLAPLKLDGASVSSAGLREARMPEKGDLDAGLRFMLVEFLTVIGDLTDEIMTPGLYEQLSCAASESFELAAAERSAAPTKDKEIDMTTAMNRLVTTGIPNLDAMLAGGLIKGSSIAIVGPPGSGKTILAQQLAFHVASPKNQVLYFSTLSEPGAKSLFYLNKFRYFDASKIDKSVHFVDLGGLLRAKGLPHTLEIIAERIKKTDPSLVVIDSFKVFDDLAASPDDLRKFSYELVVNLMARECTALFLGEYTKPDYEGRPLFSIIDGLVSMTQRPLSGEHQRFLQIVKMRGLAHSPDEHAFMISRDGIKIFAPRLTIKRSVPVESKDGATARCRTRIGKLDDLLGGGVPRGSSLLISGVAGTGKTVMGLEFVYRGALAGEKGIVFSFEETEPRLRAAARGFGWGLDALIEKGLVEIVFIPQPDIMVEHHLLMMQEKIESMGARRVALDSLSVFLHKIRDPQIAREKVFQLVSIVQNTESVGFFATDVPYGSNQISRFGVEETVVDGIIIVSSSEEGMERERYVEVYKLRNSSHLKGRHTMTIDTGGIQIFPRYRPQEKTPPGPPAKISERLSSGVPALDKLLGAGILERSVTLVSGSSGIGKSILAMQFIIEGAARGEPGLYVTLEEGPAELLANAEALGLPLKKAVEDRLVEIVYLPPTHIRSTQLLALVTDKIKQHKSRRLVLDSTTHIEASGLPRNDVRELLYDLVVRLKELGVTSVFTIEAESMYSMEFGTDRGFSPLADNVVMLRYAPRDNSIVSSIMVVKTRGSTHDKGLHAFTIGKGGLRVGPPLRMPSSVDGEKAVVGAKRRH